jgi:hypothetical protein
MPVLRGRPDKGRTKPGDPSGVYEDSRGLDFSIPQVFALGRVYSSGAPGLPLLKTDGNQGRVRPARGSISRVTSSRRRTAPGAVKDALMMHWRERFLSERGEIAPHASRAARKPELGYGFNPKEYPGLAEAADGWAEVLNSRVKRWRFRRRLKKY